MQITRDADRPKTAANPEYFTGTVTMEPVPAPGDPSRVNVVRVSFDAKARTFWHTHPLGQTLLVLSGICLAQTQGGAVTRLGPGDSVAFAPGEKHWHGAGPDGPMTHLAIQEAVDGSAADWLEEVSDSDYAG